MLVGQGLTHLASKMELWGEIEKVEREETNCSHITTSLDADQDEVAHRTWIKRKQESTLECEQQPQRRVGWLNSEFRMHSEF